MLDRTCGDVSRRDLLWFLSGASLPCSSWWRAARRLALLCTLVPLLSAAFAQQIDPNLFSDMRWRMIGPFRGGRTVAIAGIPNQRNIFYCAAVNGGVWKTTDFGQTWNPIFDSQPTGSVGAIALAPSDPNIIYVGSGEGLQRPDLSTGDGIYKSTDGGRTWQHLGLRDGQQIAAILVDPHDANRVLVAVLGHPYGANSERGVFRSTDGGMNWQKVLFKNKNTGAIDLAFDPTNSQIVYAALWVARRPPWTTGGSLEAAGSGLYKSVDGGSTWRQLTQGLPGDAEHLGRIGLGIAPSDPNRIYALVDARNGGLYRSDNAGQSWSRINTEERIWGRGDDFAGVRVDPTNQDVLYVANTSTYKSIDGGHTFTAFKGAPGGDDYHTIWINPTDSGIILLGSDQGATITVNGGQSWSSWYNQPTAQFYHVITDNRFPYWVYGGQQESGSAGVASRSDYGEISFREWHPVGVEEYGYVAPDPLNPNFIYGGKATRFDQTTGQTQDVSPAVVRTGKYRFNRTAPLIFSPVDPHVLYLGSQMLFKTTNGGHSWEIISPDLTRPDPGVPANLGGFAASDPQKGKHRGVIYTIAPSPRDGNLIWIGTDDGLVQVTRDGGKTWNNVTPPELTAWSKLAMIDVSHFDNASAYAAVNRFRLDDLKPHIYRTHDGGRTWQSITAGLPDNAAVNVVREDPVRRGLMFAGTERAVYVSFDDGDHWQSLQLNLPATSMRDLVVHSDDLVVGTHGRSFWILDDITPIRQVTAQIAAAPAYLYQPATAYRMRRDENTDTPLPPEVPAGKNPPTGAIIDYYLGAGISGPVTLDITDGTGRLVRHYSSADPVESLDPKQFNVPMYWARPPQALQASSGMHRFVWDLHYPPPDVLQRDFPISAIVHDTPLAPSGVRVLPGEYKVTLSAGGRTQSRMLTLRMDPRVHTSLQGLRAQFDLEMAIVQAIHDDYVALQQVKTLRAQKRASEAELAQLEGSSGGFGATVLSGPGGSSLSRLNEAFSTLLTSVDSADTEPTTQAVDMYHQLRAALDQDLRELSALQASH